MLFEEFVENEKKLNESGIDGVYFSITSLSSINMYFHLWFQEGMEAMGLWKNGTPEKLIEMINKSDKDLANTLSSEEYNALLIFNEEAIRGVKSGEYTKPSDVMKHVYLKTLTQLKH